MALAPVLAVVLLFGSGPGELVTATSEEQLRFGIEAARRGLWQEARFRFERAVLLDPESAQALNNLAVALEQQGEFEKARDSYEKALKLKPGSVYIQQNFDLFREADDKRARKSKKQPPRP
jgi:Flp pilus assembly protein TadD